MEPEPEIAAQGAGFRVGGFNGYMRFIAGS